MANFSVAESGCELQLSWVLLSLCPEPQPGYSPTWCTVTDMLKLCLVVSCPCVGLPACCS